MICKKDIQVPCFQKSPDRFISNFDFNFHGQFHNTKSLSHAVERVRTVGVSEITADVGELSANEVLILYRRSGNVLKT